VTIRWCGGGWCCCCRHVSCRCGCRVATRFAVRLRQAVTCAVYSYTMETRRLVQKWCQQWHKTG